MVDDLTLPEDNITCDAMGRNMWHSRSLRAWHVGKANMRTWEVSSVLFLKKKEREKYQPTSLISEEVETTDEKSERS